MATKTLQYCITLLCAGLLQVLAYASAGNENNNESAAIQLIEKLLNNSDSRIRPNVYGGPVHVKVDVYIHSLGPMNELDMDFNIEMYLRLRWRDERLSFNEIDTPIIFPIKHIDQLWMPDVYFPNAKHGSFHDITVPNRLLNVFPNGTVLYSSRLTLKVACNMMLQHFPLDYQDCSVRIASYTYDTKNLILEWLDDSPVEYSGRELTLPQFELLSTTYPNCTLKFRTGDFPCISIRFHLKRQVGFYLLQTYIPSMLIIILSWVSFWINKDAVPARISLGVTTVLTMTTQLSGSRSNQMLVSYPKAIDVWYTACMTFVFAAFLEFAFVNVLARGSKKRWVRETIRKRSSGYVNDTFGGHAPGDHIDSERLFIFKEMESALNAGVDTHPANPEDGEGSSTPRKGSHLVRKYITAGGVDKASRILFPLCFFIFNLVYWPAYSQPIVWKYSMDE